MTVPDPDLPAHPLRATVAIARAREAYQAHFQRVFSDLNNLAVYTVLSPSFSTCFGFTEP